jgi:hypothetical protein
MIVVLRPIGRKTWSGLIKYRNCYEDIGPYFTRSGRIYTGLTPEDEVRIGTILGLDLRSSSEYWKDFFIRTAGKDLYLDTNDINDELRYLFLKNHKRVKNSILENKASANFVLVNKDEEAKRSNLYSKVKREAIKAFDSLTPEDMRKCLRIYGHNGDSMGNELVEKTLFDIVEGNPQGFIDKWVSNPYKETEALIERAISKNIMRRNKNIYKYGTEIIGHNIGEVIAFFENVKNQDIKIAVMKQLESKSNLTYTPPFEEEVLPYSIREEVQEAPIRDRKGVSIIEDEEEKAFNAELIGKKSKIESRKTVNTI